MSDANQEDLPNLQLNDEQFDALMRICSAYTVAEMEERGFFEDKTDVEKEKLEELVLNTIGTTLEVSSFLAKYDTDKIKKIDDLNANGDFELAHKFLFEA